jgi:hypothetical protein
MSHYSNDIIDLATEIAGHLQSRLNSDIDFVADWLVNGGDDGSEATELVMRFDEKNVLPSKQKPAPDISRLPIC